MRRLPLQTIVAAGCLGMVLLLTVVQFATERHPPLVLYLVFSAVWLFGAAMTWWFPRFGAAGTALYGAILGYQVLEAHGATGLNVALAIASWAVAALAGFLFYRLLRGGEVT